MAAETLTREEQIERFVELDALDTVLGNLERVLGDVLPILNEEGVCVSGEDHDLGRLRSGEIFDELWPDEADIDAVECKTAQRREGLRAAMIFFALADSSDILRAEGERLVANQERLLKESVGA